VETPEQNKHPVNAAQKTRGFTLAIGLASITLPLLSCLFMIQGNGQHGYFSNSEI
jgi:hypothetical protein